MTLSEVDLHRDFIQSCIDGDLKHVLELAYYQSDLVQSLINGDIPCMNENGFPGEYQPGEYIHAAAIAGHCEIVAQLINLGAEPNTASRFGTPLEIACKHGGLDIIRLLHTHGVDLHPDDTDIWNSPIYIACEQNHNEIVQYILSVKSELLTHKTEEFIDGCILFCLACANQNLTTVKLLAEKGVDINAIVRLKDGAVTTALDEACKSECEDVIQYLLQQHVEISGATIQQYAHSLAPCFRSMKRKFTPSASIRGKRPSHEPIQNFYTFQWSDKNLTTIHQSWLSQNVENIHSIELFHNKITELPDEFFVFLPNLEELDISMNCLLMLPGKGLDTCKISKLSASRNSLISCPLNLFNNKTIQSLDLSHNKLKYLPPTANGERTSQSSDVDLDANWTCSSLVTLKLSDNQITNLPSAMHGATRIEKLNLSNNELVSFITPWNCPMEDLDLSGNAFASFNYNVEVFWTKSLRRLNLSGNLISLISWNICHLENLLTLDVSKNALESLPPPHYWSVKSLNKLNLSHNKLSASCGPEGFADVLKSNIEIAMSVGKDPTFLSNCELPVDQFQHCLQALDLSYNNLEMVPETICSLYGLGELILSNNPRITRLPPELGKLRNIWNLRLENLNIQDIPEDIKASRSAKKMLAHLRSKLRKSVPFKRMKLMVVGLQGRGKTSLLAMLQGKKVPSENIATVGISVEQWTLQPPASPRKLSKFFYSQTQQDQEIVFSTWDLAGQHVYYSTHQCFLTSNTLYLVVWNVGHGQEGIDGLAPWLLNIQARAPKSQVIIVGTHLDKLPAGKRKDRLTKLESDIFRKFGKKGFPMISGNVFVSNQSGEGLSKLKEVIYRVTSKMQDSNLLEPMIGKKVPLSYLQLYDAVTREKEKRNYNNDPPILTTDEFLQLAKENPDNDILDQDELDHAAKFLHDHGVLLHFTDHIRGLSNLYFIDPTWLCDMIALLVTVKEKNPFVKSGYIRTVDVMSVLKNPRLPPEFIPQFLQIMERFEIALRLDDEKILIPSMLPRDKPLFIMENASQFGTISDGGKDRLSKFMSLPRNQMSAQSKFNVEYVIRNYHLSYVPAGFWSRLIARLIIAVHKWGMIFNEQESNGENSADNYESTPAKGATFTKNFSMIYWREGIFVCYEAGRFLIESFKDDIDDQRPNEGLSITVWSNFGDFSVMGFIVDQIDRLISEWYPGLEDLDEYGAMTVQRMIPCPTCATSFKQHKLAQYVEDKNKITDILHYFRNPKFVNQFSLSVCALAAVGHEDILCSKHPDDPVPLLNLVPDLLLTDLPPSLLLAKRQLDFEPSERNRLGGGGAGEVFRAFYKGEQIAVKRFHSTKSSRNFDGDFSSGYRSSSMEERSMKKSSIYIPVEQSICDQLEDNKVVRVFWELRQEVAVLCRLQHPFIIGFLGVCRVPLCFGLELAPKGGLFSIIDEIAHKRDLEIQASPNNPPVSDSILGRKLTYKIALQVAHALLYLHESEIVYRDLKSDNILVWTLDESALVNVKLSDYGISCFATPQGVVGEGGTPGFQAPEVKIGCPYDEKVDIFSYGIWLYELITGHRPYREHRTSAEIRKAVNNGIRPSLKNANVECKMPYIEMLMQECWVGGPASRPSALEVTKKMEDARFLCLYNSFPKQDEEILEHVTCVFPLCKTDQDNDIQASNQQEQDRSDPLTSGDKLLLWCGNGKGRKFIIMDSENGKIQNDLQSPGHRVLCAARVGQRIWLGTEGCQIEVFGYHYWQIPKVLWSLTTRDAVMDLLVENSKANEGPRVFASLANGTVLVFKRKKSELNTSHRHLRRYESQEETDRAIAMEKNEWEEPIIINLANEGRPAKSLVFTKNGSELWVASGNCIAIINVSTLQLVEQIKVFTLHRYMINQLVTDGDRLWSIDRRSATIYQWDVEKRQKTFRFDCDLSCDATGIVLAQPVTDRLFDEISDSPPLSPTSSKKLNDIVEVSETDETVTENDSKVSDIGDGDKPNSTDDNDSLKQTKSSLNLRSLSSRNIRRVQPSFMFQRRNRKSKLKSRTSRSDLDSSEKWRPRSGAMSDASTRLGSMLLVGDTLWVGRSAGDVLVINVQKPTTTTVLNSVNYSEPKQKQPFTFGEVLSQLSDEIIKQFGLLKEVSILKKIGKDRVIAVFRTEMELLRRRADSMDLVNRKKLSRQNFDQFRFLILGAWQAADFEKFSGEIHALHSLEENY